MLTNLLFILLSFTLGALPLSVWVTELAGKDPRAVGDHNPGATNALKAGGKGLGLAALLLDVSKAAAPVGLAGMAVYLAFFRA
jgi:glycerol-3-phosphate acyltransferase PlsY